jgi:hypothetical protein
MLVEQFCAISHTSSSGRRIDDRDFKEHRYIAQFLRAGGPAGGIGTQQFASMTTIPNVEKNSIIRI